MGHETKIQWTDATINFWTGCKKVSPGCKFCYMYRDKERFKKNPTEVIKTKVSTINATLKDLVNRHIARHVKGNDERLKIFTCSWSDFFIDEADQWRSEAWEIIKKHPQFVWQILTKRPERIAQSLPTDWGVNGYENVWLGVSVESKNEVSRIWELAHIPANIRFISAEPLLGWIDLGLDAFIQWKGTNEPDWKVKIKDLYHWVIIGGESGNENGKYLYRVCNPEWVTHIMEQCSENEVACFVKQMGTYISKEWGLKNRHGGDITEWPEEFKVRNFPVKIHQVV